jgi:hypothetical protein
MVVRIAAARMIARSDRGQEIGKRVGPHRRPMIGIADCCARAASGHAIAAPPSSVMSSRRLMLNAACPSCASNPDQDSTWRAARRPC